ncbi:MAG: methyltransferase domain-containing protein [Burkholderiales bacterium]|nr:methyltransferase domain-containing protein [Burkholderiales bacterium]
MNDGQNQAVVDASNGVAQDAAYQQKAASYFANARKEVASLLPLNCGRVLELGCGSGATLAWLKSEHLVTQTFGVELFAAAAAIAREHVDHVVEGDIERMELPYEANYFDAIMCLDVLEHLSDPWRVLSQLVTHLKPGGVLIASVPNVRNWRAVFPLLFAGRWEYADAGILDRTHLRFFTMASSVKLVGGAGVQIESIQRLPLTTSPRAKWANRLTLGLLRDFITLQFLICAHKPR